MTVSIKLLHPSKGEKEIILKMKMTRMVVFVHVILDQTTRDASGRLFKLLSQDHSSLILQPRI